MFKTASGGEVSHEKFVPPLLQPKAIVIPQQKLQDCGNSTEKSTEDPEQSKKEISPLLVDVNPELGEEILRTIVSGTETSLDDIVGNSIAKDALEWAVVFPNMNPDIFTGLLQPDRGILLFGPPGNGKTMLAKAVASVSKYTFFNISAATIMSKWVGEAEKMIQALFQMAKNGQPSIIFVDELDSMLCERNESEGGCSRRVKTEFLLQFDGCMSKQTDRILVLGATNRPHELDDGILRRFPKRIFIDLPDVNTREALLQKTFTKGGRSLRLAIEPEEWRSFAESLEGYSHSDIVALCREAAFLPLRDMSRDRLTSGLKQHELRPITIADLKTASSVIRPCTNQEHLKRMREFAEKFAQTF
uniref:microtubule-severing ATPase n=1 Tax=Acrobeloides nanus TaxID=290746 RepID=A0A914DVN1_9BILA